MFRLVIWTNFQCVIRSHCDIFQIIVSEAIERIQYKRLLNLLYIDLVMNTPRGSYLVFKLLILNLFIVDCEHNVSRQIGYLTGYVYKMCIMVVRNLH